MGKHFIPQFYLKGFTDIKIPSSIWVYEKGGQRIFNTSPKNIAHGKRFYPDETELYLSNEIESPSNPVLNKIRERKAITQKDKVSLSNYITVMLKRVPYAKERLKTAAPKVSEELEKDIDAEFEKRRKKNPSKTRELEKRRREAKGILNRISGESLEDVWLDVIPQEMTPKISRLLSQMTWRFFICEEPNSFLSCDNPVFFHESIGMAKEHSELTFPISSHIVLWVTWWGQDGEYINATNLIIKEINRRMASNATRFIYFNKKRDWVVTLANKKTHRLHLIPPISL